ncbi:23S ribosomal RNA methyltransferase Erm [Oceanobacillus sp. J11TS1]|uniref:23S ribosomal RNA methyltransferase Erm n=1 Tax=Oceanobacillus sp. J11TS1 TaxID=2807191 RepID=UPI001B1E80BB|nr:23S ribosomal RNA methyltransferase Erm [Oceanobacillus sp. J11TS1]GIO23237.1 23S rRNA (adenine(2058)-N(6))-methyltransferase Erm(C) [Oceanobacillus sp. J11TS1]
MNKINPKDSQNFITSKKHINDILSRTNICKKDTVIEIGSGKGHFTREIVKRCYFITAVEIDPKLASITERSISSSNNFTVVNSDILNYTFPKGNQPYKIYGNIPYNISTKIVKKIVFGSVATDSFLIVEEGFLKRLTDYRRALGLLLFPEVDISVLKIIPRDYFHPKPRINSVLIRLRRKVSKVHLRDRELYQYFVYKLVNKEYYKLFTKNQFKKTLKHAGVTNINCLTGEQVLSMFQSYKLFLN